MDPVFQDVLPQLRVPTQATPIFKDECAYSFHTQESEGGLLVDVISFQAFSPRYAQLNFRKTGHQVYLNIRKRRVPKKDNNSGQPRATVLGIGVPGGFVDPAKNFDFEYDYELVVLPNNTRYKWPDVRNEVPMKLAQVVDGIITQESAEKKQEVTAWVADQELKESKYARTLVQLDNGKKVPKSGWKCAKCDMTENLWLNLSTGEIGCGRRNFDGTGGNGHALEHYKETGFPLVVKLGTITPDGNADVFSYAPDEDDMVKDPLLEQHLAHWGIDMKEMKKTDKTVAELEIEFQHTFEWSRILEQDKALQPLYGPGYTGLENLGNSCYMASVMQVLFTIPEFINRYYKEADRFFERTANPPKDYFVQMGKLAKGLLSGDHSKPPKQSQTAEFPEYDENCVRPFSFKRLIGEGHKEFASNRQQDALEFFQYFMQLIKRAEKAIGEGQDPSLIFQFQIEEKVQCTSSLKVKYSYRDENVLSLPIPLHKAVNKEEVAAQKASENQSDAVKPRVLLQDCIEAFAQSEQVDDFYSTAINGRTTAIKSTRLATFPKYLMVQLRKFTLDGWVPKKLDVFVDVPDEIDLELLRASGQQPGEELLPEEAPAQESSGPKIDEAVVNDLVEMGIPRVRAERASAATYGGGTQAAIEWVFAHADDPDIDQPLPKGKASAQAGASVPEELINSVIDMGFSRAHAIKALQATNNNLERAVDWLFSHQEDLANEMDVDKPAEEAPKSAKVEFDKGPARYELVAFISHLGTSTMSGHYVCHIKKDGNWVLFNDTKVAISQNPPKDMGYLYVFRRKD